MKLAHRFAMFVALSAACLLGAAAPATAQASPLASGAGAFLAQNQNTRSFAFSCMELQDGSVRGHAVIVEPASHAVLILEVTSAMFVGDALAMAGRITAAVNMPPQYVAGGTAFFAVADNGQGGPVADRITGVGVVPPWLGNLTIQQIIALIGPPPPAAYAPLLAGDIRIH